MTEEDTTQPDRGGAEPLVPEGDTGKVRVIYILYLVALVLGVTGLIGVVMAYIYRDGAPEWLRSHYTWQIRTFWIGLGLSFIGMITSLILIGWLVLLFTVIWLIVRCVKGMQWLERREAVPAPTDWWFG
ncbi:hypothetical protein KBTX_02249 [wastewater metagenome]|uniref:Transmembrane protein n=2 Tax=unclassified sequences TaxID=12908 RepID=A0A5B8RAW6_9ZZZZ|nr:MULTISPECIES: hypothetical protein [Arhodomonas]MCS4503146.1 hypothetical protein [Arhodomonas aquaeolei]QEA05920.1 hypothetical protein KBTEX_02249 [uncultured organism]